MISLESVVVDSRCMFAARIYGTPLFDIIIDDNQECLRHLRDTINSLDSQYLDNTQSSLGYKNNRLRIRFDKWNTIGSSVVIINGSRMPKGTLVKDIANTLSRGNMTIDITIKHTMCTRQDGSKFINYVIDKLDITSIHVPEYPDDMNRISKINQKYGSKRVRDKLTITI